LIFYSIWDKVGNLVVSWMQQTRKTVPAMYDARNVANEFLRQAAGQGTRLTNMELQKLVYIAHGYSLAILDRPLIKQYVEAWRYGPVIPDLYHAVRQYRSGDVTELINVLPPETLSETDSKLVGSVLSAYGRFSGPQLSTMTHREGTPWKEVYEPNDSFHSDTIPDKLIKAHYLKLLNERAGIKAA
jgi:uncharacterized phage-associated protein